MTSRYRAQLAARLRAIVEDILGDTQEGRDVLAAADIVDSRPHLREQYSEGGQKR